MRFGLAVSVWCALAAATPSQSGPGRTDVEGLVEQLGAKNARNRLDAYRGLQRLRSPDLPRILEAHIEGLPHHGRQLASNLLRSIPGDARRRLDEQLIESEHPYLQAIGAAGLVRLHERSGDGDARRHAVETLATAVRACDTKTELSDVLQEIGSLRETAVLDALRSRLKPGLPSHLVAQILQRLGEVAAQESTTSAVRRLVDAVDHRVRAVALAFLAREHDDVVEPLVELLDQHDDVLTSVVSQLEGAPRFDARLVEALLGRFASVRHPRELTPLVRLLSPQSGLRVTRALVALLEHQDQKLRDAAAQQLSQLPGGLAMETAQKLLHSGSPLARVLAADSLRRRDDRSGLDTALEACSTAGSHRAEATRVLGEFRSRLAVPVLLALLDDSEVNVRARAWTGLQQTLRSLYPFRRFDFQTVGYAPNAADRRAGIAALRRCWQGLEDQRR